MAAHQEIGFVVALVLFSGFLAEGATLFSKLSHTLVVSVTGAQNSSANGTRAGIDELHATWALNSTALSGGDDSTYKTVELRLCFGPQSQVDRSWRKTSDLLSKDKTCLYKIGSQPYTATGGTVVWTVTKEIPFADYFVRAYALDAAGEKVAYGQTSNAQRTSNLFTIKPFSGRSVSMDIAAALFSAFSVVSLFGFFFYEKYAAKRRSKA